MGWSWGTAIMGRYATQNSDKVNRLVLYAPPWIRKAPATSSPAPLGAYQAWTMEQARSRLQAGAPEEKKKDLMPAAWFEAWSAAVLATDPVGAKQTPPVVRTPNGTVQDTQEYWFAGKPLWEPSEIKAPTLIVLGEWDAVPRSQGRRRSSANSPTPPINVLFKSARALTSFSWRRIACIFFAKSSYFLMSHVRQTRSLEPESGAVGLGPITWPGSMGALTFNRGPTKPPHKRSR